MLQNANDIEPMPEREPDEELEPDREFWSQTEVLAHVHRFARSRGASPYATLGGVLRRTTGNIEPHVVLPPTVGGQVSLNLFTATVGVSGSGKDLANAVARASCGFIQKVGRVELPIPDATAIHPGTGEGLARVFKGRGKNEPGETRAHLQVPDVGTLDALAGRRGQTLASQLLAAWMGQPIGFSNNDKDSCTSIDPHSYRLCIGVGVQPENAAFFLDREKDGLPQRFLWLPSTDPHAPEERPERVSPQQYELPYFDGDEFSHHEMGIPDEVAHEIWYHHWQVNRGAEGIDPLDGHIKLTQLKVAASFAVLHKDRVVTPEWWKMAGQLITVSGHVRDRLRTAVEFRARRENAAKALGQADREVIVRERLADSDERRVVSAIRRKLASVGEATEHELRSACHSSIRRDFKGVFDTLEKTGAVVRCEEEGDGDPTRYRLGPGGLGVEFFHLRSTPILLGKQGWSKRGTLPPPHPQTEPSPQVDSHAGGRCHRPMAKHGNLPMTPDKPLAEFAEPDTSAARRPRSTPPPKGA